MFGSCIEDSTRQNEASLSGRSFFSICMARIKKPLMRNQGLLLYRDRSGSSFLKRDACRLPGNHWISSGRPKVFSKERRNG